MSYSSKYGRRPAEYASKSSHSNIINDDDVKKFLEKCELPKKASDVTLNEKYIIKPDEIKNNPIKHIIAIDGGYSEAVIQKEFPSAKIAFFQFGALWFKLTDLMEIHSSPFINPEDMQKLKQLKRNKLPIPIKNITYQNESDLTNSIRNKLYDFFRQEPEYETFIASFKWFLFEEYKHDKNKNVTYNIEQCPGADDDNKHAVKLSLKDILDDDTFVCPICKTKIYLTDVFRFHEIIDNELGAGGILGYLINILEHIMLIHIIRLLLQIKPSFLNDILFIKDGPLGFFGQTARLHTKMRELMNYLIKKHNIYLAGFEKSGAFVEHAEEIKAKKEFKKGSMLLLSNDYIYTHILPGKIDNKRPYASTSYYSAKFFYKAKNDYMYVITIPVANQKVVLDPHKEDFYNIDVILHNIEKLKCDMYDNSLFPVALVNKLVSLSNHPSSLILEKFAKEGIKSTT